MKRITIRIVAFLMSLTLLLTFASCSDKKDDFTTTEEETTQTEQVDATVEETTLSNEEESTFDEEETQSTISEEDYVYKDHMDEPETNEQPPTTPDTTPTQRPTETVTQEPTTKEPTTQPLEASINAPVNGSKADIVRFYNTYANATKAYGGKVKIHLEQQKKAEITELAAFKSFANSLLSDAMGDRETKDKTFTNGKSSDGTTLVKFLPRENKAKMSELTSAHVKTASCIKVGSGWRVKLTLVHEKVGYNGNPRAHMAAMDILTVTDRDVDPFEIVKDTCEFNYKGATIEAVVNKNGLLDSLKIYEPVFISATLKYGFVKPYAEVEGSWEQDITFRY